MEVSKPKGKIRNILTVMLKIGLIGFGGGNALIPVIEQFLVQDKAVVSKEEYEEDVMIASITPGALPVEIATGIGKRVAGWKGAFASAFAIAFPGVFLTLLFLSCVSLLNNFCVRQISYISVGISAYILCILTEYVIRSINGCNTSKQRIQSVVVIFAVFMLTCSQYLSRILNIDTSYIIHLSTMQIFELFFFWAIYISGKNEKNIRIIAVLVCTLYVLSEKVIWLKIYVRIVIIILLVIRVKKTVKQFNKLTYNFSDCRKSVRAITLIGILYLIITVICTFIIPKSFEFALKALLSSVMSFGGGDAYLTIADGLFVQSNILDESMFYGYLVPIVNMLPGSILCKTLSGIGYYVGYETTGNIICGYIVAMLGFICSILASCVTFLVMGDIYSWISEFAVLDMLKKWIGTVISGLICTVMFSLTYQCVNRVGEYINCFNSAIMLLLLYMLCLVLSHFKINNSKVLIVSISLALINYNVLSI